MPCLYGVFLYMGLTAFEGEQLIDRLLLLLMPVKYQPDREYLRHVRIGKVHLFTLIQVEGAFLCMKLNVLFLRSSALCSCGW